MRPNIQLFYVSSQESERIRTERTVRFTRGRDFGPDECKANEKEETYDDCLQRNAGASFKVEFLRKPQSSREIDAHHDSQAFQKQQLPSSPLQP